MVTTVITHGLAGGEVIAYKINQSLDRSLSIDVVQDLAIKRSVYGVMIHSDQGIHYTNKDYNQLLKKKKALSRV